MSYKRPRIDAPLPPEEKTKLLSEYFRHYTALASSDLSALSRKLPNETFAGILDKIGSFLLSESGTLAETPGAVRGFLEDNPVPPSMARLLPDRVRAFCLALNALKQWVAAEQVAMDGYILGRKARQLCRGGISKCIVTGGPLGQDAQLHHPVRDGRPPLLITKQGHTRLDGQESNNEDDPVAKVLIHLRRDQNRSWAHLRRGCLDLLGEQPRAASKGMKASARAFARKAAAATQLGYREILEWLDLRGLA
jgi:hypothetical protein